jgi:hypothetical protein
VYVEITSEALFNSGTKEIRAVTMNYPGEVELLNNISIKTIE